MNLNIFNFKISSKENKYYHKSLVKNIFVLQVLALAMLSILNIEGLESKNIITSALVIIVSLMTNIFVPKITKGDGIFILIINLLYTLGLIMILRIDASVGYRHAMWYLIAVTIFFIAFFIIKYIINRFEDKFIFFTVITLSTFLLTLLFGTTLGGSKNWIILGSGLSIQLSEFAKISYIFMISSYYNNYDQYMEKKYGQYYLMVATYIFVALFFLQGELGTAIVFFGLMIVSLFIFEENYKLVALNIIMVILGITIAYFLFNHVRVRFEIWLDPWSSYNDKGYQIVQSLFAIASGGFFGSGIGLGRPDIVPVATSDFIFPAVIEEMGIFMGIFIVLLYTLLFYKIIKLALNEKESFYSSLALNIGLLFAFQSIIMFGGVLKLMPMTGITTPFMSYGGSSIVVNFILLSIIQYISSKEKVFYEKHKK